MTTAQIVWAACAAYVLGFLVTARWWFAMARADEVERRLLQAQVVDKELTHEQALAEVAGDDDWRTGKAFASFFAGVCWPAVLAAFLVYAVSVGVGWVITRPLPRFKRKAKAAPVPTQQGAVYTIHSLGREPQDRRP